ncbi:hypothetical protein U6A24_02500 [Aquimarina gracilis]|uniref:Lipoyl-binding domain-containing protein n=1 Tax=Aquimarina gracilis TaxID=874422 RepID=A0ABU5ZQG0_9FLAO|nr:hypothetical protein [Aquimarina gracilis]MEB3344310.1 hypothetical protein [Aquimarina gracilis]
MSNSPISKIPILLLPLKLETRFINIGNNRVQLWIRVFPDQIFLESHEKLLNPQEKTDVLHFKTLEDDASKRLFWEELVAKYGVYRASWLVQITNEELNSQEPLENQETIFKFNWLPRKFNFYLYKKGDTTNLPTYTDNGSLIDQNGLTALGQGDEWIQDFDLAVEQGMGIRILLDQGDDLEFERIIVTGFRSNDNTSVQGQGLSNLLDNHRYTEGFSFLEFGTPTNNSEDVSSGHSIREEFEVRDSYEYAVEGLELEPDNSQHIEHIQIASAGKNLATALGFDTSSMEHVKNANSSPDTLEELYQKATWFAMGAQPLFMLFGEQISNETHESVWKHYSKYVKSKGIYRPIKIGNQPYGILPIMNVSEIDIPVPDNLFDKMTKIFAQLLIKWIDMVHHEEHKVPRLTGDDTQETVLEILSMQEHSHQFQIRALKYNAFRGRAYELLTERPDNQSITEYLENLGEEYSIVQDNVSSFSELIGLNSEELTTEVDKILRAPIVSFTELDAKVIKFNEGEAMVSTIEGLEQETQDTFSLVDQDLSGFQELINDLIAENHQGLVQYKGELNLFVDLFLRSYSNAMQLYHRDVVFDLPFSETAQDAIYTLGDIKESVGQEVSKGDVVLEILDNEGSKVADIRAPFDGVIKKHYFNQGTNEEIKPGTILFTVLNEEKRNEIKALFIELGQKIIEVSNQIPEGEERFEAQVNAIRNVIDLNSYRVDAWITSLAASKIESLRKTANHDRGIYFGAYGLLENLKVNGNVTSLESMTDVDNKLGGIIHTPTTAQNITSSIFKNLFLSHEHEEVSNPFTTNLTSDRIQKGEKLLEGIRQDQQLEALLGYQLERHLQDENLHSEIYNLREEFPLFQNVTDGDKGFVNLSVIDGLKAIRNKESLPNSISDQNKTRVIALIERLEDTLDASLDMLFYEAGYQVTQGNLSQAAAAIDATKGELEPPEIESIKTRIPGTAINHKLIMVLPEISDEYTIDHPRALLEPSIEKWLEQSIGDMSSIHCLVELFDTVEETNTPIQTIEVALSDLEISYLDLLSVSDEPISNGTSELELRIHRYVKEQLPDLPESIQFVITNNEQDFRSLKNALQVIHHSKKLLQNSRYLDINDLTTEDEHILINREALDHIKTNRLGVLLQSLQEIVAADNIDATQLMFLSKFDIEEAKTVLVDVDKVNLVQLKAVIQEKIDSINSLLDKYETEEDFLTAFNYLKQLSKLLFGNDFKLLPPVVASDHYKTGVNSENQKFLIGRKENNTTSQVWGYERIFNWIQGLAQVKENVESFEEWLMVHSTWSGVSNHTYKILQNPSQVNYPWVGLSKKEIDGLLDQEYESLPTFVDPLTGESYPLANGDYYPDNTDSSILYMSEGETLQASVFGLVIEEFAEHIPNEQANTGLSFNYDTPNNEPPQGLLLAVHPRATENDVFDWEESHLRDILYDTMDLYKIRMVDIEGIKEYGYVLPMTYWFNISSKK